MQKPIQIVMKILVFARTFLGTARRIIDFAELMETVRRIFSFVGPTDKSVKSSALQEPKYTAKKPSALQEPIKAARSILIFAGLNKNSQEDPHLCKKQ
jgi:hypothetical protein